MQVKKNKGFVDYRIQQAFDSVSKKAEDKFGKKYSSQLIEDIIRSQSKSVVDGMKEGHTIVCKYFGSFVATSKRIELLNKSMIKKNKRPTLVDNGLTNKKLQLRCSR